MKGAKLERCWACKTEQPKQTLRHLVGIGYSCIDRDACRARREGGPAASHDPGWWRSCPWRTGMRARVTSPDVLEMWHGREGTVVGILEHQVKLELDGPGCPWVWFRKSQVSPIPRGSL